MTYVPIFFYKIYYELNDLNKICQFFGKFNKIQPNMLIHLNLLLVFQSTGKIEKA